MSSDLFYRVLVPTDFSDCSEQAWALAQRLAGALGSELILVHVLVEAPLYGELRPPAGGRATVVSAVEPMRTPSMPLVPTSIRSGLAAEVAKAVIGRGSHELCRLCGKLTRQADLAEALSPGSQVDVDLEEHDTEWPEGGNVPCTFMNCRRKNVLKH